MGRIIPDYDYSNPYEDYEQDDWQHGEYWPVDPEDHGATSEEAAKMAEGWHGSARDLNPSRNDDEGTSIAAQVDRPEWEYTNNHPGYSSPWFVNYVTKNPGADLTDDAELSAWSWATGAGRNIELDGVSGSYGRPRVYKGRASSYNGRPTGMDPNFVVVDGDQGDSPEDWLENSGGIPMAAESFDVTDTDWIPPGKQGKAVQGTLPHVNWNQFGAPNVGNPSDVAVGLTEDDHQFAIDMSERAEMAPEPETPGDRARRKYSRAEAAGQMRLPGF